MAATRVAQREIVHRLFLRGSLRQELTELMSVGTNVVALTRAGASWTMETADGMMSLKAGATPPPRGET